ncbi:MAG: hypothetical protein WC558_11860 [Patulibacter sp.]
MPEPRRLLRNSAGEVDTYRERWRRATELAVAQHGVATRRQLRDVGLTDDQLDGAIRQHRLHPVHRGVFAFGPGRLTQRAGWSAAVLACGSRSALGYRSAAAHWELRPTSGPTNDVVTTAKSPPAHRGVLVRRHAQLGSDEVTVHAGIRVTTVARTLLDLAAVLPPSALRRAVGQADVHRRFDLRAVRTLLDRHPRHRGRQPLEQLLTAWTDPATVRSPQEERFPDLCARLGFPRPVMNAELLGMEVDAVFFDHRVAVELDGYAFHAGAIQWENDHEKRARLVAAGWTVLAYSWRQQRDDGGRFVLETLGPALRRAAVAS